MINIVLHVVSNITVRKSSKQEPFTSDISGFNFETDL